MKKFINVSPFQDPKLIVYKTDNNPKLFYDKKVAFPVINLLNAYAEKGDEIELITIVAKHEKAIANYEDIKKEVEELAEKKGFKVIPKKIDTEDSEDIDTNLELFEKLIDVTNDDDTLFADMSYGSKVMTLIINMSLNYGYRIHTNVSYGCIAYGHYKFQAPEESTIYDVTSLCYMDEIVRVLAETGVKNPKEHIRRILD